jgi:hypothetical protein
MDLLSGAGTIASIGPRVCDRHGTMWQHLEFYEEGGELRRITIVRAITEIAALVEEHVIGIFLFWSLPAERRLWCVDRADGPRQVDFQILHAVVSTMGVA